MKSLHIKKRSLRVNGHATSVSVEDIFWDDLVAYAIKEHRLIKDMVEEIDRDRAVGVNLSSAIRAFVYKIAKAK